MYFVMIFIIIIFVVLKINAMNDNNLVTELIKELNQLKTSPNFNKIRKKVKHPIKKDLQKFLYYYNVWAETEKNSVHLTEIKNRNTTNHIDHIIPISLAYKYNIDPNTIGSINNIRLISLKDNFKKNCLITQEVIDKLKELNIYIDIHNRPQRQVININKPKEIIKPIDNEVFINDNKRLSSYPKGN